MSSRIEALQAARERIAVAYSPELLRSTARALADLLAEHLTKSLASSQKVLNWADPSRNVELAVKELASHDTAGPLREELGNVNSFSKTGKVIDSTHLVQHFEELVQKALERGHNLHDPRYLGHQVPAPVPVAGLFDAVGSVTNQVMAVYEMGPWATAVERALVEQLGKLIGWDAGAFSGLATHGGSLANLTALLTARNVALGESWEQGIPHNGQPPVVVVQSDAHYSVTRTAGILGLGTNQVVRAALDERRRMDPNQLDDLLQTLRKKRHPIVAVVACACATPIGAFDPLDEIAAVCRQHGVWMHVDAAHGGSACFSKRYRHLVIGLDRADSLIWDAHKMLFVPALCAFVFYRDKQHRFEAFRQNAPYLFDPSAPGVADYDSGLKTIECTKRAATFGLWGVWSLFGPQLFEDMVDVTFDLGHRFYEKLVEASDFEPLHEPQCNIVAFRYLPERLRSASPEQIGQFQLDLRRELIQSGEFYIVPTTSNGVGALRVTIINPLTTTAELDHLMDALRSYGRVLLT